MPIGHPGFLGPFRNTIFIMTPYFTFTDNSSFDYDAFAKRVMPTIKQCVNKLVYNRSDREDIIMVVFALLCEHKSSFHPEKGNLERWVRAVTRNYVISAAKKAADRKAFTLPIFITDENGNEFDNPAVADAAAYASDDCSDGGPRYAVNDIEEVIDSLNNEDYRMAIRMHYFDGKKTSEIAAILGIPKQSASTLVTRAKQSLKKKLDESRFMETHRF